ncbi:MAG TPA: S8 family serine peptidase [Bacteroidota bacterium]|nr:S8 family serine peptidase [Bacteroidota bacterium]
MKFKQRCAVFVLMMMISSTLIGSQHPLGLKKSASRTPAIQPGVVIVKLKQSGSPGASHSTQSLLKSAALTSVVQTAGATQVRNPMIPASQSVAPELEEFSRIFELTVPPSTRIDDLLNELRKNPSVEYAEPKYIHHLDYVPQDSVSYAQLWHLAKIKASEAWEISKGDASIVIGIVDSGTDIDHPDLAANIWTNPGETGIDSLGRDKRTNGVDDDHNGFVDDWHGWDFVGKSADTFVPDGDVKPYAGNPHGTHTAGIASAVTDNNIGIASIGFKTKLMITKHGIDGPGDNSIYNGDDGILYCINNGANIVSCSWGGDGGSQYEQDIIRYALKKNVLIVASAGNGGLDQLGDDVAVEPEFPGAFPGVLSVGATDRQDKIAYFSNYGEPNKFKVFAPGVQIMSTVPNNKYDGNWSGTSMAAPMAAGLAAIVKAKHPTWSAAQLMFQLCGTADNIDIQNTNLIGKLGYGRINALRALTETVATPAPDLALVSVSIDDSQGGNGNNILEPGEQASIIVKLENQWGDASSVDATISTPSWAVTVTKASSSYGFMPGIANIDSSQKSNTSDPFRITISPDAIPTTVPLTIHVTSAGGKAREFNVTVPILPSVLLVDDDDGSNNVESYYEQALSTLGIVFERWDHSAKGTPPLNMMMRYKTVIWFTEWTIPTLDSADRAVIASYLDSGGKKFFLSGEENAWDLADPSGKGTEYEFSKGASGQFYEKYLKGKFVADDAGTFSIAGVQGDEIGDGLSFQRDQPGRGSGQNPDVIEAVNDGLPIFTYSGGPYSSKTAGVKYKGNYSLVSFSFGGFESIVDSTTRITVMDRVFRYLLGYSVAVNQVADYPTGPITITSTVTTQDPAPIVELLWTVNGEVPYRRMPMQKSGSTYTATVTPTGGQTVGRDIEYFVLVKTADGFLPYMIRRFNVNIPTTVERTSEKIPRVFSLSQNYPNPFNPSTQIRFSVAETRQVTLTVFDVLGRTVATPVNEVKQPGEYTVNWNAEGRASGVYFYRLEAGAFRSLKSMTLIR